MNPGEMAGLIRDPPVMILTVDFRTTVTKVGLWHEEAWWR
jgi:hypothetical protein